MAFGLGRLNDARIDFFTEFGMEIGSRVLGLGSAFRDGLDRFFIRRKDWWHRFCTIMTDG